MTDRFLAAMILPLRLLPLGLVCALGRALGFLLYYLDRRHARLALSHLQLAFPEMSQDQMRRIAKDMFIRLGEGALEFFTYRNASLQHCLAHCETVNERVVHETMKRGKGLIFLTAHCGNWELLGILGYAVMRDYTICAVGRESGNKVLDRFVQEIRQVSGLRILPKKGALRAVLTHVRGGNIACFLADQIAGTEGVGVQFFGRNTQAISTPAYVALKTGAPIIPVFIERIRAGHHRIVYCDPIEPVRSASIKEDVFCITQQGMSRLEEFIRHKPDHWFWLHKRWKSKRAKKKFQDAYRMVVLTPHWIGDALMSLPAQATLRKLYPNAHITVAYPRGQAALYSGLSTWDEALPYGWTPGRFSLKDRVNLVRKLRRGHYDMAVLFVNSFDSAWMALCAGIRYRVGYGMHGRGLLLSDRVALPTPATHHAQRYQRIVDALGDAPKEDLPPFSVSAEDLVWAREFLKRGSGGIRVALHPGATYGPTKRWFPERFVQLGAELAARDGIRVVFLGTQREKEAMKPFLNAHPFAHDDAMGKTDLGKLIALISQCDLLIANDSGPMHLASLVKVPVLALFGSTDPQATLPLGEHFVLRKPIVCSPCLKRRCANVAHPLECLNLITVPDVLQQVDAILPLQVSRSGNGI